MQRGKGTGRMEKDREESCHGMGGVEQVERARDRDSRETKLNVPFSIFESSTGTSAGTIRLMIRFKSHKD